MQRFREATTRSAFALVWALLFVSLAAGQEATPNPQDGGVEEGRARRADTFDLIRLNVRSKPLREVLQGIGRQVDVNIVADPGVDETVTIELDSVEWRKALELIARETNCVIVQESPRLIRFTQPTSVKMEFQDADLKFVLEILAKQSGANIVIAEDVTGKVTLALQGVPWRQALETVVKTAGYVTVEDRDGIIPIIRVVRPETLQKQLVTKVLPLRYIRPPESYIARIEGVEEVSVEARLSNASDEGEGTVEGEFTLLRALRGALSDDGEIEYDLVTNTLIVKDVETNLNAIESIVERLDVQPALVQVDVKFISTSSEDILETGIKYDLPDTPEREGLRINAFAPSPDPLISQREAAGTSIFTPQQLENGGTFPFQLGRFEAVQSSFNPIGVLDFTETRLLLSLVRDDDNSKIVQEPTLTTLDNHPATIFVGESVPFAVQRVQQDQNGNVTVELDENERSPVNIGFTLYISPHVVPGTDMININVIPKVSSLTGTTAPIDGFERFEFTVDDTGGLITFIDLPRESAQTVVTYLRVQNGHTAVIGGLHSERKFEIETRIPILASIPLIGNAFKWRRRNTDIDHLLILITPRIISTSEDSDAITEAEIQEAERYDYFVRKYGRNRDGRTKDYFGDYDDEELDEDEEDEDDDE